MIQQYWKLKRQCNYGNSLINPTFAQKFEEQLKVHRKQINSLRFHLERLRTLVYMISRREKIKRSYLDVDRDIFTATVQTLTTSLSDSPSKHSGCNENDKYLASLIVNHQNIYSTESHQLKLDRINKVKGSSTPINASTPVSESNQEVLDYKQSVMSSLKRKLWASSELISSESLRNESSLDTDTNLNANQVNTSSLVNTPLKNDHLSDKNVTNFILRELKRTKARNTPKKMNPYAKVYLNFSANKRTSKGNNDHLSSNNVEVDESVSSHQANKIHMIKSDATLSNGKRDSVHKILSSKVLNEPLHRLSKRRIKFDSESTSNIFSSTSPCSNENQCQESHIQITMPNASLTNVHSIHYSPIHKRNGGHLLRKCNHQLTSTSPTNANSIIHSEHSSPVPSHCSRSLRFRKVSPSKLSPKSHQNDKFPVVALKPKKLFPIFHRSTSRCGL